MKFIKDTTWEDVFEEWRTNEASDPGWINCAVNIKGWPDWESWRRFGASHIRAGKRTWQMFEFTDPMNEIPRMLIGPFTGWQARFLEKNKHTFEDMLNTPEHGAFFKDHNKIVALMKQFPSHSTFIGLIREDTNQIVCLEGSHRATAVALAKKESTTINFTTAPHIALAILPTEETPLLDTMLERGSSKNPETQ